MKLKYIGPYAGGVVVPLVVNGTLVEIFVAQGATEEFPDDVAASMLEQEENWQDASDDDPAAAQVADLLNTNTRPQLNELAAAAGVDAPESLPNKEAVARALVAAGTPEENS